MTRQFDIQTDQPVFVRATPPGMDYLKFSGRKYKRGDHLPWQELGLKYETIKRFMDMHFLHHSEEKTVETKVGDGLDMMSKEELHTLVDKLNAKVKANTTTEAAFNKQKCKKSQIREKQMGLIRSWRRHYGKFEAL